MPGGQGNSGRSLEQALQEEIAGEVRFDKVSRAIYSTDASVYQIIPVGVVIPRSGDDVVRTVRICREHGVSITARGGGTSQAGQAIGEGIQLDYSKYLNRILGIDVDNRTVRVEPGIVLDELNAALAPHGLHLPLDISTSNCATIGGMINNNAAGTRSIIYGVTIDYVVELTVVLADGSVVVLEPLTDDILESKCGQGNLEGEAYRTVGRLARIHRDEIMRRYPKLQRRVGGYNLDVFANRGSGEPFNLCKMVVGSEGTLAQVLEAKLRIVEPPQSCAVVCVQFRELLEAMAATPRILKHRPSAVELVDGLILGMTRGKPKYEPLRSFIKGDPKAVLIVEFIGEKADALSDRVEQLVADLQDHGFGHYYYRALEKRDQARIWNLRKAGLGLCMAQRGDAKSISFVEDTVVDPENLHDYIRDFVRILEEHDTEAGFYAHASVGLLHIRPVVNMKRVDGVRTFAAIAGKVADLVLKYGGALSGEHGDGLVRAPFQEKMFGPTLYGAFREVKRAFDPHGLFNPGKIVDAPEFTRNLRFGPEYQTPETKTAFDFGDFGGLTRAAEQCGGLGACRKTLSGTMCPSYLATRDEKDTTRGRANALRLAMTGKLGLAGLSDPALCPVFDLCLECKACKTECPTGVDMARIKSEFLHQYGSRHGRSLRTHLLAHTRAVSEWGCRFAPVSNWWSQSLPARWMHDRFLGIDRRRRMPRFSTQPFVRWWARNRHHYEPRAGTHADVVLFADTFTNFYEPAVAKAALKVAKRFGFTVSLAENVCCGRPLISKGFLDHARRQATALVGSLDLIARQGIPVVFLEPGCLSAVKDDYLSLLTGEDRERGLRVAEVSCPFETWALKQIESGRGVRRSEKGRSNSDGASVGAEKERQAILIHNHCHQKALFGTDHTQGLFEHIFECDVVTLESSCCGMAGSFGYEKEHYAVSRSVGEQRLFSPIRNARKETTVVASGFSCRHQIAHFTDRLPVAPAVLLDSILGP